MQKSEKGRLRRTWVKAIGKDLDFHDLTVGIEYNHVWNGITGSISPTLARDKVDGEEEDVVDVQLICWHSLGGIAGRST